MNNSIKISLLMLSALLVSQVSSARCSSGHADHLLNTRFKCPTSNFSETVHYLPTYKEEVLSVCGQGCNMAALNSKNGESCNKLYEKALAKIPQIEVLARQNKCKDSGSYSLPKEKQAVGTPGSSCRWLSRQQVKLNCASGGCSAKGNTLCTGEVVCATPFNFAGQQVPANAYSVSCLAGADCDKVPLAECFADESTTPESPLYDPSVRPSIQKARSVN